MREASPPVRSYGQLARRVLADPGWQDNTAPQPRSLAALFSKLDRGVELEWLADRQHVQFALAQALQCPAEEISRAIRDGLQLTDRQTRRLRFDEVRYARALDLLDDDLPPGIPDVVQQPARWGHCWWVAPSGSGRSLVGAWLAARGLASYVSRRSWSEATSPLPVTGNTFCELHVDDGRALDAGQLPASICIAAPFPPPPGAAWQRVPTPPLASYLDALLVWLEERLPQDGSFDAESAAQWLAAPMQAGLVASVGDVIGIAGVLDELGTRRLRGRRFRFVARHYVDQRLQQAVQAGNADAQWLRQKGFEAVVGMVRRCLVESSEPLEAPRTEEEWLALVPAELQQSADADWLRASLARSATPKTMRDLERALTRVPPGAFRVLRALLAAEILRKAGPDLGLVLAPGWLRNAALQLALDEMCSGSSTDWGEALLQPRTASKAVGAARTAFRRDGDGWLEDVLENVTDESPTTVIAFELAFRFVGFALLGADDVSREHTHALWKEQRALQITMRGALPMPRLGFETCSEDASPWLTAGGWYWAYLAVSTHAANADDCWNELLQDAPAHLLDELYGCLCGAAPGADWIGGAFSLLAELRARLVDEALRDHPVFAGLDVRSGVEKRRLRWVTLVSWSECVASLNHVASSLGDRWPRAAQLVWQGWQAEGFPHPGQVFPAIEKQAGGLCAHIPEGLLAEAIATTPSAVAALPLEALQRSQWFEVWSQARSLGHDDVATLLRHVPADTLRDALESGVVVLSPAQLEQLWEAFPAQAVELVCSLPSADLGHAVATAQAAGPQCTAPLVAGFAAHLAQGGFEEPAVDALRLWLLRRIAQRRQDWRKAYTLLSDVQTREDRLRRARGASSRAPSP